MKSNIENDYNQCFIGNHLKDERKKKSFSKKIRLILLRCDRKGQSTTRMEM